MWIDTFIIIILLCVPRGGDDDDHDRCKHIKCVHIFFSNTYYNIYISQSQYG